MIEQIDKRRPKLVKDYQLVYESIPQLKELALGYWEKTGKLLSDDVDIVEEENLIFSSTVLEMAKILLEDKNFQAAMSRVGTNSEENAIVESVLMIETVLDIEEESNKNHNGRL